MKGFWIFIGVVGAICAWSSTVVGIGVFIYDWGVEDMKAGAAAWNGFTTWVSMLVGGIIALVLGSVLSD